MPQANSTTSMPRVTEPLASASVLPCSALTRSASSSMSLLEQLLELEHDARAAQRRGRGPAGQRRRAPPATAASTSAALAKRHAAGRARRPPD